MRHLKNFLVGFGVAGLITVAVWLPGSRSASGQGSLYPQQVGDVHWRYPGADQAHLPTGANAAVTGGNSPADVRVTQDFYDLYVWTGTAWKKSYSRSGMHGESST